MTPLLYATRHTLPNRCFLHVGLPVIGQPRDTAYNLHHRAGSLLTAHR
ncbi:MAG: hypothetical protein ABTQ73_08670 [Caldilineales bacterium]